MCDECCICLEPISGRKISTLACSKHVRHCFHESCLLDYRVKSLGALLCPICRQPYLDMHSEVWKKIEAFDHKHSRSRKKEDEFGKLGNALVDAYRKGHIDSSDIDSLYRNRAVEVAIEAAISRCVRRV